MNPHVVERNASGQPVAHKTTTNQQSLVLKRTMMQVLTEIGVAGGTQMKTTVGKGVADGQQDADVGRGRPRSFKWGRLWGCGS